MNSMHPQVGGWLLAAVVAFQNLPVTALAQGIPPPVDGETTLTLIERGSVWRYFDRDTEVDPAWRLPAFDDSQWAAGPAQLGYGEGDEATPVHPGADATRKRITTYFRRGFELGPLVNVTRVRLRLLRDDGAVVFLNGHEVLRDNMPGGAISSESLAASAAGADENQFHEFILGPSYLVSGLNVVAVEVHQVNATSTDLGFDLGLEAVVSPGPPLPVVSIAASWPETVEPSPTTRVRPAEFTITRDGETGEPLLLFVEFAGTATFGHDYQEVSPYVVMPAGEKSVKVLVAPVDDAVVEGDETVVAALSPNPPIDSLPNYRVDPQRDKASVVIHDNDEPGDVPVVSLSGAPAVLEFCPPNALCVSLSYGLRRTGPGLDRPLTVFLQYSGTATVDFDYHALPQTVTFERGNELALFSSAPIDDALQEGDETIVVRIIAGGDYRPDPDRREVTTVIRDNEEPALPVVDIVATGARTGEPCPVCLVAPGIFTVSRTGPTAGSLKVYLDYDGPAEPGQDYQELPHQVIIPAGQKSVDVILLPFDDPWVEGPEIARARILTPELATLGYVVNPNAAEAIVVIGDDEAGAPEIRLDLVEPDAGAHFAAGTTIRLSALGVWTQGELDQPVGFFDGKTLIGRSDPPQLDRPTIPGLPSVHTILWTHPPPGPHLVTARFADPSGVTVTAPPVAITVGPEPPGTVVGIEATHRIAEETSFPFRRLPLRGEFTISRTGATGDAVSVFVNVSGLATPGVDYPAAPLLATIPAGAASTQLEIVPAPDDIPEGIETLVATLSECPPATDPPLEIPCRGGFAIDPLRAQATVFIRDDGVTEASLTLTHPKDGAAIDHGGTIVLEAVAIDLNGSMHRIEFMDGGKPIGVSEIVFIRAPDPGTPIVHTFEWTGAAAGPHVLTARVIRADGTALVSPPVGITVGGLPDHPPGVAITSPAPGSNLPANTPIEIVAEARDPDGYVHLVEFFADGRKLGDVSMEFIQAPEPNQLQTFRFVWREPSPGPHTLTARAIDDNATAGTSAPVGIKVGTSEPLPIVIVTARDPVAVEPQAGGSPDTATFRIHRFGPIDGDVAVAYSLGGMAQNGVDYQLLGGSATIPAGLRSVQVVVQPLADGLNEGVESVVLRLDPPPPGPDVGATPAYRLGHPRVAAAVISDLRWLPAEGAADCQPLGENLLHLRFAAETGENYRLEASGDLRNWETLSDGVSADGAWHFIDLDMPTHPCRFYRLSPEPVTQAAE